MQEEMRGEIGRVWDQTPEAAVQATWGPAKWAQPASQAPGMGAAVVRQAISHPLESWTGLVLWTE